MKILVHNIQEKVDINNNFIKRIAREVLKTEKLLLGKTGKKNEEINIVFVDNQYIKGLNKKYLKKDRPTDVMAFSINKDSMFGDIFISVEQAEKQAEEYEHILKAELALLVIHGVLHLLGYDDEKKKERSVMKNKENEILKFCLKEKSIWG